MPCIDSPSKCKTNALPLASPLGRKSRSRPMASTSTSAPSLRYSARWDEPQSGTRQAGLVLVGSEVYAGGYGAGRARDRSTRSQDRFVGRSAAGAAVGVVEEKKSLRMDLTECSGCEVSPSDHGLTGLLLSLTLKPAALSSERGDLSRSSTRGGAGVDRAVRSAVARPAGPW